MLWNDDKVLAKIKNADTEDLLDRFTAYRRGMEPAALVMIEEELHQRGVSAAQIAEHRERCERECVFLPDGTAAKCSFCERPAIHEAWGWQKLLGKLPVFPRWLRYCRKHLPGDTRFSEKP
jgi:hypothetical protein